MTKTHLKSCILTATFVMIPHEIQAANITINLEGKGEVVAQEANINCTENCVVTNDLSKNTLVASANSGWDFSGWSDQKCDSGSEAVISKSYKTLGTASGGAKTLITGDLNNDNLDDLVTISLFNGQVTVKLNEGGNAFDTRNVVNDLNYPTALDLFDWDADGDLDIFVAEYGSGFIKMYVNNGNGDFSFNRNFSFNNARPYAFAIADKNNDDLADFLISSFTADISGDLSTLVTSIASPITQWHINAGDQFFAENKVSNHAAMTIDIHKENDQISIISAEIENGEVALYKSGKRTVVDIGGGTYGAAFGDIDNDGFIDVLAAHYRPSRLNVLYGKNNDQFSSPHIIISPSEGVTATTFGDYNQDGYIDVATGEFNSKIFYYFPTISYKDCIISTEADITVTATFTEEPVATTPSNPAQAKPVNDKSSGGSLFFTLLLLGFLTLNKRKTH